MRGRTTGCGAAARGRHAVVHDRVRPRHDHHVPADAAASGPSSRAARCDALAELQATEDDPAIDAEPGKIVHEVRRGQGGARPGSRATTARSTRRRSTSSCSPRSGAGRTTRRSCASCASPRCARSRWIDELRRPRRRRLRRVPAALASAGSTTSRGRTRATRSASPTAASPSRRSRRARCRATSTTRSGAWPSSRARSGATASSPSGSTREADELAAQVRRGVLGRGARRLLRARARRRQARGRLALLEHRPPALERDRPARARRRGRRRADGRRSSGRAGACARCPPTTPRYNPLAYHNGTVWPHDNSLIAWGLARYGRWPEAQRIVRRMLDAAAYFDYQLPEVFAGFPRAETPFPIAYPTAARPQAWAAGTPVLLLQRAARPRSPTAASTTLETIAPASCRRGSGALRLAGVRAFEPTLGRARRGRDRRGGGDVE